MKVIQVDHNIEEIPFPKLMVNSQNEVYYFPNRSLNVKLTGKNIGSTNYKPNMGFYTNYDGSITLSNL